MFDKTIPMRPIDAGWFHMDGETNLAMVTGVVLTRQPLDFDRVKATYAARLKPFDRFRQRVVETGFPLRSPHWQDDPYFDIDDHVHHVALPDPCDKQALMDFLSDLASTPLDYRRPLWQVHVIDRVDGGSALVLRFHHCVGDGTAMLTVAQRLFDTDPDVPVEIDQPMRRPPQAGMLDRVFAPARATLTTSGNLIGSLVSGGFELLQHPTRVFDLVQGTVRTVGTTVATVLKTPDPKSPFRGKLGVPKRVAWSEPVALEDVKAIGRPSGAKVNDVLVAAMAGALRSYMLTREVTITQSHVRALVPVDLRPPDRALELGNFFGLVYLDLAVGVGSPGGRLRFTKERMDALKQSPEAAVILGIIDFFGHTPKAITDIAVTIFTSKASVSFTNVAGPREACYMAGSAVDQMMFWVPHPGSLGMGISILSYNGQVTLGVAADAGLVPDPETITAAFEREFATLLAAVKAQAPDESESPQCAALTAQGKPCKNRPMHGSAYCRVHQPRS